jgi:transposase
VPIKTDEQLDMQSLHRARERWIKSRTSLVNQIRGLLLERGITIRKGRRHAEAMLSVLLEDAEANLSGTLRRLLAQLMSELRQLASQIADIDATIMHGANEHEACQRLMAIPGIGPITATAMVSQSPELFRLARAGAGRVFHRRQAEASRDQQAREWLFAQASGAWSARHIAMPGETVPRSKCLVGEAGSAGTSQHRHHCSGQQDGSHGMRVVDSW